MPFVHVRLVPDGITPKQKAEVISGITDVLVDVLGKKREGVHVVFDYVEAEDWGWGGRTEAEHRRAAKRARVRRA